MKGKIKVKNQPTEAIKEGKFYAKRTPPQNGGKIKKASAKKLNSRNRQISSEKGKVAMASDC